MALIASGIGALSALGGLWLAWELDTPAGSGIVCVTAVLFVVTSAACR